LRAFAGTSIHLHRKKRVLNTARPKGVFNGNLPIGQARKLCPEKLANPMDRTVHGAFLLTTIGGKEKSMEINSKKPSVGLHQAGGT
jgi:hypothetical protein